MKCFKLTWRQEGSFWSITNISQDNRFRILMFMVMRMMTTMMIDNDDGEIMEKKSTV